MSKTQIVELNIGDKAPDFKLPTDGGGEISLSDQKNKKVIVYFYPKDNTPGCTTQACDFRDNMPEFEKLGTTVIGISKDSVKKHDNFKAKHDLNFVIASDENTTTCEDYGVWKEKQMYGKTYWGIERTTFLIDENGLISAIWNKVKVKAHIDELKAHLSKLDQAA